MDHKKKIAGVNPKQEVEALFNDLLPFAKKMIVEHGEFFPYGGYLDSDGTIVHAGATDIRTDRPKSATLVEMLNEDFRRRAQRKEIRASAVVFDVRITPPNRTMKTDAIQINLEHIDSYCAEVFLPYRINDAGVPEFDEIFAQAGCPVVFK